MCAVSVSIFQVRTRNQEEVQICAGDRGADGRDVGSAGGRRGGGVKNEEKRGAQPQMPGEEIAADEADMHDQGRDVEKSEAGRY